MPHPWSLSLPLLLCGNHSRRRLPKSRNVCERDEPQYQRCKHGACNPIGNFGSTGSPQYPRKLAPVPIVRWYPNSIGRIHSCVPRLPVEQPRKRRLSSWPCGRKDKPARKRYAVHSQCAMSKKGNRALGGLGAPSVGQSPPHSWRGSSGRVCWRSLTAMCSFAIQLASSSLAPSRASIRSRR